MVFSLEERFCAEVIDIKRHPNLFRQALLAGDSQFERASKSNFATQQGPDDVTFLPEKANPRCGICGHMQVGCAAVLFLRSDSFVSNHDGRLPLRDGSAR